MLFFSLVAGSAASELFVHSSLRSGAKGSVIKRAARLSGKIRTDGRNLVADSKSRLAVNENKSEARARPVNHLTVSYISDNESTLPRLTLVLQFIIFEINKGGNLSELSAGNYSWGPALSIKDCVSVSFIRAGGIK